MLCFKYQFKSERIKTLLIKSLFKVFYWNLIYFLMFQKQVNASNYVLSSDKYFIALESNYSKVSILIYCLMKYLVSFSILLIVVTMDKCFFVFS